MTITLTDAQFATLVNGLHVAAKKFETNATELRADPKNTGTFLRLAETFEQQAKDTWELSYVFNGAESVTITVADDQPEVANG